MTALYTTVVYNKPLMSRKEADDIIKDAIRLDGGMSCFSYNYYYSLALISIDAIDGGPSLNTCP